MTVRVQAPAKINLGLSIIGKRPDGYHDICSIVQTVGLCDELTMTESHGDERSSGSISDINHAQRLFCNRPDIPSGPENLVLKAEEIFCRRFGIRSRIRFELDKRIPVGAGLAGGSTDAAAALRGLGKFHGIDVPAGTLEEIAAGLGSDIPFLIRGGTAVITGRGETVTPIAWPFDFTYVLVYPGFGISTAWAYRSLKNYGYTLENYRSMIKKLNGGNLTEDSFFGALGNDFEPVVYEHYPELADIRNRLDACDARASILTGSGSSLLGIFDDRRAAGLCADSFKGEGLDAFIVKKYQ
ncbi:4-(cytidine 5'-diphospho)-2-C-methyl-D-erythritol kinase [bacterium]|nr:4-(cytidine 5'-diphospho)-2-C-methyl-D-erythritol kinase [bacterium]